MWGAVASAVGSIAGAYLDKKMNDSSAKKAQNRQYSQEKSLMKIQQQFNSSEALKQRQWEEKMSNTAHQRAMTDLKKAGLNPILSAMNPASTPSGASASAGLGGVSAMQGAPIDMQSAVGDYNDAKRVKLEEQSLRQQLALQESAIRKNEADIVNGTRDSKAYARLTDAQAQNVKQTERETAVNTALLNNQWNENILTSKNRVNATNSAYATQQADNDFRSDYDRWVERAGKTGESMMSFVPKAKINVNSAKKSLDRPQGYNYYNAQGHYTGSRQIVW